jgi:hypothetical protein
VISAERELQRVVERWQQLPLDHALSCMRVVRPVVQALADAVADAERRPHVAVPDLGPGVVMDQLAVMVHDARLVGGLDITGELARLRQRL